jgi:nucleoside diphosphate kinase
MKILYMASIYGLVTEKKNYSGFYGKNAAKPFFKKIRKTICSGFSIDFYSDF